MEEGALGSPSWDLFIIIFLIIATGYGFVLQKEKATATLLSTYVALVVTTVWGESVYKIISGNAILANQAILKGNINPFTVKVFVFALFIVLLSLKGEYLSSKTGAISSTIILFLYSFLNAGLIITSIISFMDDSSRMLLLGQSNVAAMIYQYHNWWIVLPAIIIIIAGFKKRSYQQPEN